MKLRLQVFDTSSLSATMRCMASAAALGGGAYPFGGLLTLHWNLCGIVPGCSKQIWQESSVMFHFLTLHFRTCGHCPPLRAEASDGAHTGSQSVSAFFPGPPPATIALMVRAKSRTCRLPQGARQSEEAGAAVGTKLRILFNRHLRTDCTTAVLMVAGESVATFHC